MGNYINNSLGKDEKSICEAKVHWGCLVPHILLLFVGVGFFTIWSPLIRKFTTELGYSNKRIIGKTGMIKTAAMDSPLSKINNVSIANGMMGKIFKYGNITITTSSGTYSFKGIANAEQFKSGLMAQIDQFDEDRIKKQATEMARAIKDN